MEQDQGDKDRERGGNPVHVARVTVDREKGRELENSSRGGRGSVEATGAIHKPASHPEKARRYMNIIHFYITKIFVH